MDEKKVAQETKQPRERRQSTPPHRPVLPAPTLGRAPRGRSSAELALPTGPQSRSYAVSARLSSTGRESAASEKSRRPGSALRRYLLRSREATLRQSSRKQNSGYWRQISRPTSSRSRCFSFSPIVRTQGTISVNARPRLRYQLSQRSRRAPIHTSRPRPTDSAAHT
uniref:Uncharacterized protein n=1 Tax=Macaca fascicularis TaxID=9541 RepID=A0A7N9CYH0_MACFA